MSPSADEVRAELERVLASEAFIHATRLGRFLRFVVERTLAGHGERLKEYVIGVEVFDRDAQYDPRLDSIVRVEAGRLRAKLEDYYAGAGSGAELVITMQRGAYVPAFEPRASAPLAVRDALPAAAPTPAVTVTLPRARAGIVVRVGIALAVVAVLAVAAAVLRTTLWGVSDDGPTIAVLPFAPYSADPADKIVATRVTEGVTAELVRAGGLGVVASTSARRYVDTHAALEEVARALHADILLEARLLKEGDRLRVEARLVDGTRSRKFWVETFVGGADDLDELCRRVAAAAAAAVPAGS